MMARTDRLLRQIEAYHRLLAHSPASVARYYLSEIQKIEAEIAALDKQPENPPPRPQG